MNILGIETSCDDTSAAVVENGTKIITNIVSSQIKLHSKYGGIVPELASRHHLENLNFIIETALKKTKKIDAVSVTNGPGLIGSLLIGTTTAQAISRILKVPIVEINHIEGHFFANYLSKKSIDTKSPFLTLIVSGGHTDLILLKSLGKYKILGRTRDDAVGEVFDKIAKFLNLGYPGGPIIDKLAEKGDCKKINFPRPYMRETWDFSFSGLKTAVINYTAKNKFNINDLCSSFQKACTDVLVEKTILACKKYKIKRIFLGGGVSSNSRLRTDFTEKCKKEKLQLFVPDKTLCTDNAAMIATAGYFKLKKCGPHKKIINPSPNLELENWEKRRKNA